MFCVLVGAFLKVIGSVCFFKADNIRGSFFMFVESGCISKNIEFTVPYVYIF